MLIQQNDLLTDKVSWTLYDLPFRSSDTLKIKPLMKPNKYKTQEKEAHEVTLTFTQTFLYYLFLSFKRHQSAARSEPYNRAIDAVFMCVTPLYACSVGACERDNRGGGLSAGLSIPNLLLHAKGGVSDKHEGNFRWTYCRSELLYINLRGCLCFCETKHMHMNDRPSWL